MNRLIPFQFSGIHSAILNEARYGRILIVRFYAAKKGKRKKNVQVRFDPDLAEEFVDLQKLRSNMQSSLERLRLDYINKVTLEIHPHLFHHVRVVNDKDKEKVSLGQVAEISLKDNHSVVVDLSKSPALVKAAALAIKDMAMNYEPVVDGQIVTFSIPRVTQEYRENLAKLAKQFCENSKLNIRKVRQKGLSDVRKNKQGKSEDDAHLVEKMIQQLTSEFTDAAEVLLDAKTRELLKR